MPARKPPAASAPSAPLMTPADVAAALQLSYYTVLRRIKSGDLVACDVSAPGPRREYRIRPADLAAYLERVSTRSGSATHSAAPSAKPPAPPSGRSSAAKPRGHRSDSVRQYV